MLNEYGYVCPRFDGVAQNNDMLVTLPVETYRGQPVAVAFDPRFPALALITPIVGLDVGAIEYSLWRVAQADDNEGCCISVVYGRDYDNNEPLGMVNGVVQLASRPTTHSIHINKGLMSEALEAFETDDTIELSLIESDSPDCEPWEALIVTRPGGEAATTAVITPIATLTNTGRHGTDAPRSEPSPTRPVAPWLDATNPNNDPEDGDTAWVAVKGRKGWTVALCFWDEAGSEWLIEDDSRALLGFVNHRDLDCYHCPMSEFPGQVEAFDSLNLST